MVERWGQLKQQFIVLVAFINHLEVSSHFWHFCGTSTSLYIMMPIADLFWSGQTDRRTEQIALPFVHALGVQNGTYIIIVTHSHTVNVHWYQIFMYLYQQLYNSSPKVGLWIKGLECHMELHPNTTAIVLVQMSWLSLLFSAAFPLAGWQEDITHG